MKVLTATSQTQGWRHNDFCWAVEGELVFFAPFECGRGSIDDECGCRRSMAGLASHRATTTMKVVEREDLDPETYFALIADGVQSQGYVSEELLGNPNVNEWVHDLAHELIYLGACCPIDTVFERRGDVVAVRPVRRPGPQA
jgi:hypothetical protein